ncbi:hypothetical protein ACVSTX_01320 [Yersinia enterocolitica]
MSTLTPVFKNCPQMTTIALWPRSFEYQKGHSEVSLVMRLIDITASKHMHQDADKYHDITGYSLPLLHEISDEEARNITEDCELAIVRIQEKINEEKNKATTQENKIRNIRSAPLQPVGASDIYGYHHSVQDTIEHEKRILAQMEAHCEKSCATYEQAIRIFSIGKNISPDSDNSWIFSASFNGLKPEIKYRTELYKEIISAINIIVTLRNEEIKHIPYSAIAKYNHLRQEYINDELHTLTKHYYSNGSESIRHAMTLQEYTKVSMPRIERDAATALLSVHTKKENIV